MHIRDNIEEHCIHAQDMRIKPKISIWGQIIVYGRVGAVETMVR